MRKSAARAEEDASAGGPIDASAREVAVAQVARSPRAAHAMPVNASDWAVRGLFVLALLVLVREAKPLLAPVAFAVMLTFVFSPAVRALRRRGIPEMLGAALIVITLVGSTVPLAGALAGPAADWWERAPTTVGQMAEQFDRLRAKIPGLAPPAKPPRGRTSTIPLLPPVDPLKDKLASEGMALTGALIAKGATFAISASATVILLYFLLASEHWMLARCVETVRRPRTRALVLAGVRAMQLEIGRYLFSVGLINIVVGAATGLAVHALGLPSGLLWGVIAGTLNFIPYLGAFTVTGALALAGMVTFDNAQAMLAPAAAFVVVHAVESNFVSPMVVGRRLSISPISVFLSVMFWGWLWGIAGAVLAVPMLIALRTVCRRNRKLRWLGVYLEGGQRAPLSMKLLLRNRSSRKAKARRALS